MRYALCGMLLVLAVNPTAQSERPAGGSIAGTVLDPNGTPIADVRIVVAAVGVSSTYGTRTDDRGRYRIDDIAPGRYYVKAGGCAASADLMFNCPIDAPIYVFHPGTDTRDAATVFSVSAGVARSDVNFTLDRQSLAAMWKEGARLLAQASELWTMKRYAPANRATWSSLDEM